MLSKRNLSQVLFASYQERNNMGMLRVLLLLSLEHEALENSISYGFIKEPEI